MSFVSISSISFRISCCFISTTSTISDASWCLWAPMQHLMQIGVWQSWQWTSHLWPWCNLHSGNTQCIFLFLNGTISCDRDWCLLTQFTHKIIWQLLQNSYVWLTNHISDIILYCITNVCWILTTYVFWKRDHNWNGCQWLVYVKRCGFGHLYRIWPQLALRQRKGDVSLADRHALQMVLWRIFCLFFNSALSSFSGF